MLIVGVFRVVGIHLGNRRYVSVYNFGADDLFHIGHYRENIVTATIHPTTRGVTLNSWNLAKLLINLKDIDDAVKSLKDKEPNFSSFKLHLGDGLFVLVESGKYCITLRQNFMPEGQLAPIQTNQYIALTLNEWDAFRQNTERIKSLSPRMFNAVHNI